MSYGKETNWAYTTALGVCTGPASSEENDKKLSYDRLLQLMSVTHCCPTFRVSPMLCGQYIAHRTLSSSVICVNMAMTETFCWCTMSQKSSTVSSIGPCAKYNKSRGCHRETTRCCMLFPTPTDSLIVICFRFQKVNAVIVPALLTRR